MRVLQITPGFHPAYVYGGAIESVYRLCCHLAYNGCEVAVLTTDTNGVDKVLHVEKEREVEMEKNLHVRYCKRLLRHTVSPVLVRLLPSYIRRADVVHLTSVYSFPTIPTLFVCRLLGKPLVWSPRGSLQRWEGSTRTGLKALWEWICRLVAPTTLILHTTSEEEAHSTFDRFPNVDVVVIPNGVQIPNNPVHVDEPGMLRLLYLGRLHPIKGIENLLAACKMLKDHDQISWSLAIAGAGDERYTDTLRKKLKEVELIEHAKERVMGRPSTSAQVKMVGEVVGDAKERLFENADVVIVPSHTENFGIVIAEALAHGVPVIASRGTPWRRVEEMRCGLWVDNDPESLAKAIMEINRMPLREMGDSGRDWMQREFGWDQRAREMRTCYESLCERARIAKKAC